MKNTKISELKNKFAKNSDVKEESFMMQNELASIFFVPCLVDATKLFEGVLEEIKNSNSTSLEGLGGKIKPYNYIVENTDDAVKEILKGSLIVAVASQNKFLVIPMSGVEKRAIQEPPTAAVVKGPREGFVEDLNTNLGLIRKRLKSPRFCVEKMEMGVRTNTEIAICYLQDVADKEIVEEIKKKLSRVSIDGIMDAYYIQSLLESKNNKIFKQIGNTEKPDIAVAKMLEGRIAIVIDGSPIVLTLPFIFLESLQSADDYYSFSAKATYVRIIRLLGLFIAITLPGIYVAMQSYHYKILPINFLISLMGSIQSISFPPIIEILFVLFLFEILSEASVRMPKYLGMALSIIGALVLGNTAVEAGIISSPSIVVVAISGITLYTVPDLSNECSLLRTLFTLAGGIAGLFGILLCLIILTTYLADITSFKSPYLAPYAPVIESDKKDGIFKQNLINMSKRPKSISNKNKIRIKEKG